MEEEKFASGFCQPIFDKILLLADSSHCGSRRAQSFRIQIAGKIQRGQITIRRQIAGHQKIAIPIQSIAGACSIRALQSECKVMGRRDRCTRRADG